MASTQKFIFLHILYVAILDWLLPKSAHVMSWETKWNIIPGFWIVEVSIFFLSFSTIEVNVQKRQICIFETIRPVRANKVLQFNMKYAISLENCTIQMNYKLFWKDFFRNSKYILKSKFPYFLIQWKCTKLPQTCNILKMTFKWPLDDLRGQNINFRAHVYF